MHFNHWQSFLSYRKTDGDDYEPDTQSSFAAKYTYGLLTKFVRLRCMGYWPSVRSRWLDIGQVVFCVFMDRDEVEVHKLAKKERGQYPAILTE